MTSILAMPIDERPIAAGRELLASLVSRSSVPPRQLVAPGPAPEEMNALFAAALAAPSHGGLQNARFITIAAEQRNALADLFEAAKRDENSSADEDDIRRARDKAYHAPTLVLIVARIFPDHPDIPAIEQIASAGASMGAILYGAHALGYGAMAVSGEKLATNVFRAAFSLTVHEQALCFIALGSKSKPVRTKPRIGIEAAVTSW